MGYERMAADLSPTLYLQNYQMLTLEVVHKYGIRGILTDLDDTLVIHNSMDVPVELAAWVTLLQENGIGLCIVSNNGRKRVEPFAQKLGVPFLCNAAKPCVYAFERAYRVLNIRKDDAVFLGDQLFTDIFAAKRAGIRSVLVDPVGERSTWFVRWKRKREIERRRALEKIKNQY